MTSFIANYAHYCMIIQLTKTRIIGITIQTVLNYVAIVGVYLRLVLKDLLMSLVIRLFRNRTRTTVYMSMFTANNITSILATALMISMRLCTGLYGVTGTRTYEVYSIITVGAACDK